MLQVTVSQHNGGHFNIDLHPNCLTGLGSEWELVRSAHDVCVFATTSMESMVTIYHMVGQSFIEVDVYYHPHQRQSRKVVMRWAMGTVPHAVVMEEAINVMLKSLQVP